jgi:hypothetical protein
MKSGQDEDEIRKGWPFEDDALGEHALPSLEATRVMIFGITMGMFSQQLLSDSQLLLGLMLALLAFLSVRQSVVIKRAVSKAKVNGQPSKALTPDIALVTMAFLAVAFSGSHWLTQVTADSARDMIAVEYRRDRTDYSRIYAADPDNFNQDCADSLFLISTGQSEARQPSWSPDKGSIVYTQRDDMDYWNIRQTRIHWREDELGKSSPHPGTGDWLTKEHNHHSFRPQLSPDGRSIAYLSAPGRPDRDLEDLGGSALRLMILQSPFESNDAVSLFPPGVVGDLHGFALGGDAALVYSDVEGRLWELDLNPIGIELEPRLISDFGAKGRGDKIAELEVSVGNGQALVYAGKHPTDPPYRIAYATDAPSGLPERLVSGDGVGTYERSPAFSPEGNRVAYLKGSPYWEYDRKEHSFQIWVGTVGLDELLEPTALTECVGSFGAPSW